MTDDTTRPDPDPAPPDLPEQEATAGTGPLPDLPDTAYGDDATDLPEPEVPSRDDGDEDPDSLAGDFANSDVDLDDVLGPPSPDQDGEG